LEKVGLNEQFPEGSKSTAKQATYRGHWLLANDWVMQRAARHQLGHGGKIYHLRLHNVIHSSGRALLNSLLLQTQYATSLNSRTHLLN